MNISGSFGYCQSCQTVHWSGDQCASEASADPEVPDVLPLADRVAESAEEMLRVLLKVGLGPRLLPMAERAMKRIKKYKEVRGDQDRD